MAQASQQLSPQQTAASMASSNNRSIFNEIPYSVRKQIFKPNLIFRSWAPEFPALVVALRGEPHLQREALAILYETNIFKLSGMTTNGFWASNATILGGIRHLFVEVDKTPCIPESHVPNAAWLRPILSRCTSLEDLTIHCASHDNSSHAVASDFIRSFPKWLSTLRVTKKITVIIPWSTILSRSGAAILPEDVRDRVVQKNILEMDERLDVAGRLVRADRLADGKSEDCDEYVWERDVEGKGMVAVLDCSPVMVGGNDWHGKALVMR